MSDIRNFFGKGAAQPHPKAAPKKTASRKRVISESEDEEEIVKPKPATKKAAKPAATMIDKVEPKEEELVDPEAFFGDTKISKVPAARSRAAKQSSKSYKDEDDDDDYGDLNLDAEDLEMLDSQTQASNPPAKKEATAKQGTKRKEPETPRKTRESANSTETAKKTKIEADSDVEETVSAKPAPAKKATPKKNTPKKTAQTAQEPSETSQLLNSIPTVALPEPGEPVKFQFGQAAPGASAPGSKEIPEGADGCLSGLTFVFTGILESLERTQAQDLVKKYGGKVTTAPSKNTSFVVLGEQAGPKKIEKIAALGVKTIDEDGLLKMIAIMPAQGGDSASAQKAVEKRAAEDRKAQEQAREFERLAAQQAKENARKAKEAAASGQSVKIVTAKEQLWTDKYAPTAMKDIIGNKTNVDRLTRFLDDWPKNLKANFKKPGPDGLGLYRAVLMSGPPGVGKTTAAHLVANLAGYDVLEFNASDTRSKRLLDEGLKGVVNNTSLNGYFGHGNQAADVGKKRLVLIMDEVDGMSAGDRGGVGALNAVIRKTTIPIICICNDRQSQKLKPLDRTTIDLKFSKPTKEQARSRIMSIAYREGLTIKPQAIDQLVEFTGGDIRQIINLLSTYRLTASSMDQEQGREGAKNAEKHFVLKPWDIVSKLLNGAIYHERSKVTLNEKIELYFNDHDLSYLMVQENYLNCTPDRARNAGTPKQQALKRLQLASKAAGSISDGDLVDNMIRGQQQWSLMPVHGVFSCVRPASFVAGSGGGRIGFTAVLGNMSKLNKATRLLRELRAHLRLRISGDRHEIRRDYIPILFNRIPKTLATVGAESINDVIQTMDDYYLTRDDYDALLDLGIGENAREHIESAISSADKSSFTRIYNKASHPTAFLPASAGPPPKKLKGADMPDFEDAVDVSDDELPEAEEEDVDEDAIDLKNDKLIQAPKKKPAGKSAAASKANGSKAGASKVKGKKK